MKVLNKIKGDVGEAEAVNFLKKHKYKILETNYKNKIGEIDIIAQKGQTICFVEVKRRQTAEFGLPREAVDRRKQQKIAKTAQIFLLQKHLTEAEISFSVVEIMGQEINLIENAFEL